MGTPLLISQNRNGPNRRKAGPVGKAAIRWHHVVGILDIKRLDYFSGSPGPAPLKRTGGKGKEWCEVLAWIRVLVRSSSEGRLRLGIGPVLCRYFKGIPVEVQLDRGRLNPRVRNRVVEVKPISIRVVEFASCHFTSRSPCWPELRWKRQDAASMILAIRCVRI